ncbi:MAG: hypothetical protein IJM53_06280 [Lachnospiraceae bacterium]|nr:hypothetical protein [Lachnospiraceae bacterium]
MKKISLFIIPILILCFILAACNGNNKPSEETTGEPENPAEISEKAMDNFLAKLSEGTYTMDAPDYCKISVQPDEVIFDYADNMYDDFAVVSINNESFQGFLTGSQMSDATFLGEGRAFEVAAVRLPTALLSEEVSQGNIYNLFYNTEEDPLKFVSYEAATKQIIGGFAGYGAMQLGRVQDVYLVLDGVDVNTAHFQAEVTDDEAGGIVYDDIDITVTFGNAEGNEIAEKWMNNPVYPEGLTEWPDGEIMILDSIFLPGYGLAAVPFPTFRTYAFKMDQENFYMTGEVNIRDSRATEDDMKAYAAELINQGFAEVQETQEDGTTKTWYRRILREEAQCYSSINLEYDNGVTMVAKKYYEFPVYDGLEDINKVIVEHGYLPMTETDVITSWHGDDAAYDMTEGWNYFYLFDMALYVSIDYTDYDALIEYLNQYIADLEANGFKPVYTDDPDNADYYESPNGAQDFRYHEEPDGTVTLLFKSERYITPAEVDETVRNAGFPGIMFEDYIEAYDRVMFQKVQFGMDYKFYYMVIKTYESREAAETFLNNYEAALNEAGFDRASPSEVEFDADVILYNESTNQLVGIKMYDGDNPMVYMSFVNR